MSEQEQELDLDLEQVAWVSGVTMYDGVLEFDEEEERVAIVQFTLANDGETIWFGFPLVPGLYELIEAAAAIAGRIGREEEPAVRLQQFPNNPSNGAGKES